MRKLCAVSAFVVACACALVAQGVTDTVKRVADGDTVTLTDGGSTRLIGIDTPEVVDPRKAVQAFGKKASAFTKALLPVGTSVRVEAGAGCHVDRYGRTLAYLYLPDGRNVNLEIVRSGLAHAYLVYAFDQVEQFLAAERDAKAAKLGLWAKNAPVTLDDTTVYVTLTGKTYHTAAHKIGVNGIPIRLDETPGHFTACKVCKPPMLK